MRPNNVRAIVAAHGTLAAGLVSAVQAITGRGDALEALSNTGLSARDVAALLAQRVEATGARVVFTDLPAGSCTLAARRLQRDLAGLAVATGVNLPMLLEFVLRDDASAAELATAVERGREHTRLIVATDGR